MRNKSNQGKWVVNASCTLAWLRSMQRALFMLLLSSGLVLAMAPAYSASKTLLVLGDSLSAEYGLPRGSGWVSLLEQKLHSEFPGTTLINASISGETSAGGRARLDALLKQHRPALVVLELGGNDGLRGLALSASQNNLREMIQQTRQAGARTLLIGLQIPPNYGASYSHQFKQMYQSLGREPSVTLVPFLLEGLNDTERYFQTDRIHPNQQAQAIMLSTVWAKLRPLVK
jgi:acyl-CoA thioesterase-1